MPRMGVLGGAGGGMVPGAGAAAPDEPVQTTLAGQSQPLMRELNRVPGPQVYTHPEPPTGPGKHAGKER
jgi:hypothetical protein